MTAALYTIAKAWADVRKRCEEIASHNAPEPKREGLERLFIRGADAPDIALQPHAPSIVSDTRGASSGHPAAFVVVPLPGDWGNGWDKDCGPFCGSGGNYL